MAPSSPVVLLVFVIIDAAQGTPCRQQFTFPELKAMLRFPPTAIMIPVVVSCSAIVSCALPFRELLQRMIGVVIVGLLPFLGQVTLLTRNAFGIFLTLPFARRTPLLLRATVPKVPRPVRPLKLPLGRASPVTRHI